MGSILAEENNFLTKGESLTTHYAFNTIHQKLFLLTKSLQSHMQIELTFKDEIEQMGLEIKNLQTIVHLIDDSTKQTHAKLSLLLKNKTPNTSTSNSETIVHLLQNLTQTIQTCIPKISLKACHICQSLALKSKRIKANTKKLRTIKIMVSRMQRQTHMLIMNSLRTSDSNDYAQISHAIETILHTIECCKELSHANACSIVKIECIAKQLNTMTKTLKAHVLNFQD